MHSITLDGPTYLAQLSSTYKVEGLRGQQHFFSYQMLLQPMMLVKVALLIVLHSF